MRPCASIRTCSEARRSPAANSTPEPVWPVPAVAPGAASPNGSMATPPRSILCGRSSNPSRCWSTAALRPSTVSSPAEVARLTHEASARNPNQPERRRRASTSPSHRSRSLVPVRPDVRSLVAVPARRPPSPTPTRIRPSSAGTGVRSIARSRSCRPPIRRASRPRRGFGQPRRPSAIVARAHGRARSNPCAGHPRSHAAPKARP